jgi:hypothetical protein
MKIEDKTIEQVNFFYDADKFSKILASSKNGIAINFCFIKKKKLVQKEKKNGK